MVPVNGLVSVIVPVRNRPTLVLDALSSVYHQSYPRIELIVVDDGSVDHTRDVIKDWLEHRKHRFVRTQLLSQPQSGAPTARNLGIKASTGEYVQFLDSDDIMHEWKLERQAGYLNAHPEIDIVWSRWCWDTFGEEKKKIGWKYVYGECAVTTSRLPSNPAVGLLRHSLVNRVGFWSPDLVRHQDWEWTTRMLLHCRWMAFLPGVYHVFRQHLHGRISDLKTNKRKALNAKFAAALSASRFGRLGYESTVGHKAYRRRIWSRCMSIAKDAVALGEWGMLQKALQVVRYC